MAIPGDLKEAQERFGHAQLCVDDSFLNSCDPLITEFYEYWQNKCRGNNIPLKGDLLPEDMFHLLPYIFIVDGDGKHEDFRYRLMGGNEALARKGNPTGKYIKDANAGNLDLALFNYHYIHREKHFLFLESDIFKSDKMDIRDQTLFLPVSLNGTDVYYVMAIGIQHRIFHKEIGDGKKFSRVRQRWENDRL